MRITILGSGAALPDPHRCHSSILVTLDNGEHYLMDCGHGASNWWVLAAPKGTPAPVIDKLHAAAVDAVKAKSVLDQFARSGFLANPQLPQELAAAPKMEADAWAGVIKKAAIALPK